MSIEEKDLNQQMEEAIISIRTFARSFTGKAGIIDGKFGSARNPLPKSRVLFEINEHPGCTAKYLVGLLNIDAGYMSKIVKGLQQEGFIRKERSTEDARVVYLYITEKGIEHNQKMVDSSTEMTKRMIGHLSEEDVIRYGQLLQEAHQILTKSAH